MDGSADLQSIITTATEIARSARLEFKLKPNLWQSTADGHMLICLSSHCLCANAASSEAKPFDSMYKLHEMQRTSGMQCRIAAAGFLMESLSYA